VVLGEGRLGSDVDMELEELLDVAQVAERFVQLREEVQRADLGAAAAGGDVMVADEEQSDSAWRRSRFARDAGALRVPSQL